MKKLITICAVVTMVVVVSGVAQADTTINFDELGSLLEDGFYYDDPFVSEGFQFDMSLMSESAYQNVYSNTRDFPSSYIAVYCNGAYELNNPSEETTVSRVNGQVFNFLGANIGGFTYNNIVPWYAAPSLVIEGYNNGFLVDSMETNPLLAGFDFIGASIMGVDTLKFIPTQGTYNYSAYGLTNQGTGSYWMMDNFKYSTVPVPGAVLLGSLGVGIVGWMKRRRSL